MRDSNRTQIVKTDFPFNHGGIKQKSKLSICNRVLK